MKYRKKPVVIEAVQWNGDKDVLIAFVGDSEAAISCNTDGSGELKIGTLEGIMTAQQGDYIIRGVKGEYYPCKPDIFKMTYEPVTE